MDGNGENYAKWNRPGTERQILHFLFKYGKVQSCAKTALSGAMECEGEKKNANQRVHLFY